MESHLLHAKRGGVGAVDGVVVVAERLHVHEIAVVGVVGGSADDLVVLVDADAAEPARGDVGR